MLASAAARWTASRLLLPAPFLRPRPCAVLWPPACNAVRHIVVVPPSKDDSAPSASGSTQDGEDVDARAYRIEKERAAARAGRLRGSRSVTMHEEPPPPEPEEKFRSRPDRSMTVREQDTFQRLFKLIQKRTSWGAAASEQVDEEPGYDEARAVEENIDLDIEEEVGDMDLEGGEFHADSTQVNAYPKPLREMARQTNAQEKKKKQVKNRFSKNSEMGQVLAITKPIWHRLTTAKTDTQIWDVLEKELFSKIRALDLDRPVVEPITKKEKTTRKRASAAKNSPATDTSENNDLRASKGMRPGVVRSSNIAKTVEGSSLIIFSLVYQRVLLHAAKLLCRRTSYTPLAFALLPTIKFLGPSSYAMGISSGLFNELLIHHWRVSNSLAPVLSLLTDMDSMNCPMNVRTVQALEEISLYRSRAEYGNYGQAVRQLELMPDRKREGKEILNWKKRIQERLELEQEEKARREAQEKALEEEGVFADNDEFAPAVAQSGG